MALVASSSCVSMGSFQVPIETPMGTISYRKQSVNCDNPPPVLSSGSFCRTEVYPKDTLCKPVTDVFASPELTPEPTDVTMTSTAPSKPSLTTRKSTRLSSRPPSSSTKPKKPKSKPKSTRQNLARTTKYASQRSVEERIAILVSDPYTVPGSVTKHTVRCLGCKRILTLDRRQVFYPGPWTKHRDHCSGVKDLKARGEPREAKRIFLLASRSGSFVELKPRYLGAPLAEVYCVSDGCKALDDPNVVYPLKVRRKNRPEEDESERLRGRVLANPDWMDEGSDTT